MKINITVGKCKYCAEQIVLINDYMAHRHPCPGHIVQCREYECDVPEEILRRRTEGGK